MIKLYTDKFYNTAGLRTQYEKDYQDVFAQFAKTRKYAEMVDTCKLFLPQLRNLCNIQDFPGTFNELIIIPPKKIAEIFEFYIKSINPSFNTLLDNNFEQKKNKKGHKYILDYKYQKYSEAIAKFFIDNESKGYFNVTTCYYCNMSYINTFKYIKNYQTIETKRTYDLDHFIPKNVCGLFALCLYNFVPSCKVCNQLKSDNIEFSNLSTQNIERLFPTSCKYDYDEVLKFRIKHKNLEQFPAFGFLRDGKGKDIKNEFEITFEGSTNSNIYEDNEGRPLHILERYEPHKAEFLNYMEKRCKYPPSFFTLFAKSFSMNEAKDLNEVIFNVNLRNEERQIFQKIYNDLDEQF